ncbi:MAG: HAMP domain-containing histidine kinase [Cyclobacteriaceae bacterium]|nr:HAMP domain-containing histidine kinase [Cyclobacteriaceae bacterium]
MKRFIRDLIIGKNNYIESWTEYRQVILSGQFAWLAILVCLMYAVLDFSWSVLPSTLVYALCILMLSVALVMLRKGKHCTAHSIIFITLNVVVYLFASSESPNTGAFILFIPVALGAFAVFNYKQRVIAVNLACFTYTLFVLAYFADFSILPRRLYNEHQLMANFMINFAVALPTSILALYLLISLNHHNGRELVNSNRMLKKLNEELDRFVYSTSHDLRAPLSSIAGLINLAKNNPKPDEVNRYLNMMGQRVSALDKFIKDITDYSRNNRLEITKDRVNVYELAQNIWESLMYCAEAQSINFINEIPQDLIIENDSKRLHIVLANLISNAIRYHDNRKENKYIRVFHHDIGSSFSLHIEDNGQGIAPEIQKKVFDMFYRGNETSQGSGLGLYIVKETINKLAGTVHLYSQPRKGSTFIITLPLAS